MAKRPLSDYSIEELEGALRSARLIQLTVAAIFSLIILVWIVGGYVTQNTPVFISTVAMAIAIVAVQHASTSALRKELASRRQ